MEKVGATQKEIWSELNVIRNPYTEWVYNIGTYLYGFFCDGDASHDKWFLNKYKIEFSNDKLPGKLGHFIRYKKLFNAHIKLKFYNVIIEYADVESRKNTVCFDADKRTFYIDKSLYDKARVDKFHGEYRFRLKCELLRQLQIAVMNLEGHSDFDSLYIWQQREQRKTERMFSKYDNQYYTSEEMYESNPIIYQADMVADRYEIKRIMRKTGNSRMYSEKGILPYYPYERLHFYDKNNNLNSALEHDRNSKDPKLKFYEEPKYDPENTEENFKQQLAYNEEYERYNPERPYDDSVFDSNSSAKQISDQNSQALNEHLIDDSYKTRKKYRVNEKITAGNSGYFDHNSSKINVKAIKKAIENYCKKELSNVDTAGRVLDSKMKFKLLDCALKNEDGQVLSFFRRFTDINATDKMDTLDIEFSTLNECLKQFFDDKKAKPGSYNGTFAEYYINSVKPLVIKNNGWNTVNIIKTLYNHNQIAEDFYNRLLSIRGVTGKNHKNIPTTLIVEKIKSLGYDSIIYIKDDGKIAVTPLYSDIIIPVAENGITKREGYLSWSDKNSEDSDDFVVIDIVAKKNTLHDFESARQKVLDEPDNTQKLKLLAETMISPNKLRKSETNVVVGSSGLFEKGEVNFAKGYRRLMQKLLQSIKTPINNYDTAGRKVPEYVKKLPADYIIKDADGRPISLFMANRFGKNRIKHAKLGLQLSSFNAAIKQVIKSKLNHPESKKINLEEYFVMAKNPYYLKYGIVDFTPAVVASDMFVNKPYNKDTITQKELEGITNLLNAFSTSATSSATTRLKKVLKKYGYDSIVYMNTKDDPGSLSIIVFDESQLIPVSVNGLPTEKYEGNFADSTEPAFLMSENTQNKYQLSNDVEKDNKNIVDEDEKKQYTVNEITSKKSSSKKKYATVRPKQRKSTIEKVWAANVIEGLGMVLDPSGVYITWDRTKPRNGQWDLGHKPGQKYSDWHKKYMNDEITEAEFLEWYHNPDNYRVESPSTNRSHRYE